MAWLRLLVAFAWTNALTLCSKVDVYNLSWEGRSVRLLVRCVNANAPLMILSKGGGWPLYDDFFALFEPISSKVTVVQYDQPGSEFSHLIKDLGRQVKFEDAVDALHATVQCTLRQFNKPRVVLLGWASGGYVALEVAKAHADVVSTVLFLSTPLSYRHMEVDSTEWLRSATERSLAKYVVFDPQASPFPRFTQQSINGILLNALGSLNACDLFTPHRCYLALSFISLVTSKYVSPLDALAVLASVQYYNGESYLSGLVDYTVDDFNLATPAHFIYGRLDPFCNPQRIEKDFERVRSPFATLTFIDRASHYMDNPADVSSAVGLHLPCFAERQWVTFPNAETVQLPDCISMRRIAPSPYSTQLFAAVHTDGYLTRELVFAIAYADGVVVSNILNVINPIAVPSTFGVYNRTIIILNISAAPGASVQFQVWIANAWHASSTTYVFSGNDITFAFIGSPLVLRV